MPDLSAEYIPEKDKLTEKYFDMVYRLAVSQTKDKAHADDVVQEVFLRFFKYEKAFESEEHVKAWLLKVTINCSRDVFLNSWFKKTTSLTEVKDEPVFDSQEKSDIYYAVSELPQKYRGVIHLFYYEGYSVSEIAKIMDAKESTVKSQLHRAREMLKEKFQKGGAWFV